MAWSEVSLEHDSSVTILSIRTIVALYDSYE